MQKSELIQDIKNFLVTELKLKIDPSRIDENAAIFGKSGLGVDSIDGIQVGLAAEQKYGIKIAPDSDEGRQALSSVSALADHILRVRGSVS